MKITLLAEKIAECKWEAFADAYRRLNTATPVEVYPETLQSALKSAGVRGPEELNKLLKYTDGKKYLCMSFELTENGQKLTFSGSNKSYKIKDPLPPKS